MDQKFYHSPDQIRAQVTVVFSGDFFEKKITPRLWMFNALQRQDVFSPEWRKNGAVLAIQMEELGAQLNQKPEEMPARWRNNLELQLRGKTEAYRQIACRLATETLRPGK